MPEVNLFLVFLERLNKSTLPYMVTGSVASIIYGEPRMTHDVDIVLQLHAKDVQDFIDLFPPEEFYCPAREVVETETARRTGGHFNIIHHASGFKADIYPAGRDELHKWAMAKRRNIKLAKSNIWVAPPEYVIIRKLQYYKQGGSPKHLRDIKKMFELSDEIIDKPALNQMITKYELSDEWQASKSTP